MALLQFARSGLRPREATIALRCERKVTSVLNSFATGRHLAVRLLLAQAVAALLAAVGCLPWGWQSALTALSGGVLVMLGTVLLAARGLTRGRPGVVLARMLSGMVLRWAVVLGGTYVVLVRLSWPPAPLIAGLVVALLAPLALRWNR